jgi:hypothetical protein
VKGGILSLDEILLFPAWEGFDRCLLDQCIGTAEARLLVDDFNRPAGPGVAGGEASIVLMETAIDVFGDTGIERSIPALEDVECPTPLRGERFLGQRICLRHPFQPGSSIRIAFRVVSPGRLPAGEGPHREAAPKLRN